MTPEQALNRLDETVIGDLELKIALSKALEKLITMDLIDRQALLRKLFPYEVVDKKNCVINAYAVEKIIKDMPAAGEGDKYANRSD
jgi:hypothetical protein